MSDTHCCLLSRGTWTRGTRSNLKNAHTGQRRMAGGEAPTQELKAEREGVLAKMRDRSLPVAALLPPQASP